MVAEAMPDKVTDEAQVVALQALSWIVGNDELRDVFLGASGACADDLKTNARDPAFLASVLDFLLMDDVWITGFCDANNLDYLRPAQARQYLPGGNLPNWT